MPELNTEEMQALESILETLQHCEQYFKLRDRTNAQIHLALPKYSPITKQVSSACRSLEDLLEKGELYGNENGPDNEARTIGVVASDESRL